MQRLSARRAGWIRHSLFIVSFILVGIDWPSALGQTAAEVDLPTGGLSLPVDCQIGTTCWILNYFDATGDVGRDFRCHARTYAAHDGIDFAIRDMQTMAKGVVVVASAAGLVVGVRDGQPDGAYIEGGQAAVRGSECGNGVLLDHGGGWQTQYCHLRRGSVAVHKGDHVGRGVQLGLVGLSGRTEFPHAHLTVRQNGVALDPFTGRRSSADACGGTDLPANALWRPDVKLAYSDFDIYAGGFSDHPPNLVELRTDASGAAALPRTVERLLFWAAVMGVEAGDRVAMEITDPSGAMVAQQRTEIQRTQAWFELFTGRKSTVGQSWAPGVYRGVVIIERTSAGRTLRQQLESATRLQ